MTRSLPHDFTEVEQRLAIAMSEMIQWRTTYHHRNFYDRLRAAMQNAKLTLTEMESLVEREDPR